MKESRKKKWYKFFRRMQSVATALSVILLLSACGSNFEGYVDMDVNYGKTSASDEKSSNGHRIGVAMPTKDLQRWVQDGENMEAALQKAGYMVDLQYANNDAAVQNEQIKGMVEDKCEIIAVAAIDSAPLAEGLGLAKQAGIPVISYDRLILDSDAITYYATFDNQLVGTLQGQYIEEALDLKNTDGPYNIELFTGDPGDNNCKFFFGGAMQVLQPYIDAGKLVVPSGQLTQEECSIESWSTIKAKNRMSSILSTYYANGKKLDAVLSSNDSVANGITEAVQEKYKDNFPILTGQDCDINSVKYILDGKQSMSIFKDTRILAGKVVEMIEAIVNGTEIPINDTTSYDNGTGIIPSFLCEPVFADKSNYKELLLDSGYYTEDQLK